jgi:hypothetical protein
MPRHQNQCLSMDDLQYLMGLLDKAEEEIETEVDEDKREAMSLTRKRIIRIRLALIDLDKKGTSQ